MHFKKSLDISDLLSPEEREEYFRMLHIIRTGISSWVEAGKALTIIRDKRLYREKYDTFELFCKEEFRMSKSYANRLITGRQTIEDMALSGFSTENPPTERVARELSKATNKTQAWEMAKKMSGNGKPTSSVVKKAVSSFAPDKGEGRSDREFIERMRTVNRLLRVENYLYSLSPDIVGEAMGLINQAIAELNMIKKLLQDRRE
jgi:hypothetical protein